MGPSPLKCCLNFVLHWFLLQNGLKITSYPVLWCYSWPHFESLMIFAQSSKGSFCWYLLISKPGSCGLFCSLFKVINLIVTSLLQMPQPCVETFSLFKSYAAILYVGWNWAGILSVSYYLYMLMYPLTCDDSFLLLPVHLINSFSNISLAQCIF